MTAAAIGATAAEFVVYSRAGEAAVRVATAEDAERFRTILGGRIEQTRSAAA